MTAPEQAVYDGYYTTVSLFMAAIPADISLATGTDERWEAEGYDDWGATGLDDPVTFDNFVGAWPDNIVCLRGHSSTYHNGDLATGFVIGLGAARIWNSCIYAGANAGPFLVEDLVLQHYGTTLNANISIVTGAPTANTYKKFCRVLAKSDLMREGFFRIKEVEIEQCLVIDCDEGFAGYAWHTGEFFRVRGSVAANCNGGFIQPSGNVPTIFENNVAYNSTTVDFFETGTITGSNNAGAEVVTLGIGTITTVTSADFVDAVNDDFHLASGSQLDGAGTDLSAIFTVDIDGDTITAPYPIGFDFIAAGGIIVSLGQGLESDSAQALTLQKTHPPIAQAIETDLAQLLGRLYSKAISQAIETDSGFALAVDKVKAIAQASETDLAQTLGSVIAQAISQAIETDSGFALAVDKIKAIAQAAETDQAQTLGSVIAQAISQAIETDIGFALAVDKVKAIVQATETDQAQTLGNVIAQAISQATETDIGFALAVDKVKAIAQASETDQAQPLITDQFIVLVTAIETNMAQPVVYALLFYPGNPVVFAGQARTMAMADSPRLSGFTVPGGQA